jgi:hypothetical protein
MQIYLAHLLVINSRGMRLDELRQLDETS